MPTGARSPDDQFGLEFVKKGFVEDLPGCALSRAKERREEVEYGATSAVAHAQAEATVEDAQRFVDRVRQALATL